MLAGRVVVCQDIYVVERKTNIMYLYHNVYLNATSTDEYRRGLIDKRQGQQRDYAVTAEIKAELIQQFAFNAITGKATSSQQLCQQVNEACGSDITDRSLRLHINKLGLSTIKNSLCKMVDEFKKNSRD